VPSLKVDLDACQGYANCVVAASDAYDLDDDGKVILLLETIPPEERERVEVAARSCPAGALWLEDA
jgi:ferredoxin